jgi:hypothetical protein
MFVFAFVWLSQMLFCLHAQHAGPCQRASASFLCFMLLCSEFSCLDNMAPCGSGLSGAGDTVVITG